MKKILVTYGSKKGGTKEIANRIAQGIDQDKYEVSLKDIASVGDVKAYDGLVIGSSVYMGQWHKGVVKFIEQHEDALDQHPVWLFSSGPTGEGDPLELTKGWQYPAKLEGIIKSIGPESVAVFHGNLNNGSMNGFERFVIKKVKAPVGDFRQWDIIDTWAREISLDD